MAPPGLRFSVRLTPRGGADRIEGVVDGVLRVRVSAPAVEGAANAALLWLLAGELGLPRSAVALVGGATARTKILQVREIGAAELLARWPGLRL